MCLGAPVSVIHYAVSLGHHRSLVFYLPTDSLLESSFQLNDEQQASYRQYAGDGIFRLSVGIEDADDLCHDLNQALEMAPEHQLANYNMGTIYDELDEFETAREYYQKASAIPDAHYNLARLFEVRGDELTALRHMREYRRLLEADISGR